MVCAAVTNQTPAVIGRRRLTLINAGLPTLPYHHDTIGMRADEANALVARVRRSIAACASRELRHVVADMTPAHDVVALAIREPVFPTLPQSVAAVHESYRLQCAADGVMYQLALCRAARDLGLDVHEFRRGSEIATAAERLAVAAGAIESFVTSAGRPPGPPWTQEHRTAYAAGIAVLAGICRVRL